MALLRIVPDRDLVPALQEVSARARPLDQVENRVRVGHAPDTEPSRFPGRVEVLGLQGRSRSRAGTTTSHPHLAVELTRPPATAWVVAEDADARPRRPTRDPEAS